MPGIVRRAGEAFKPSISATIGIQPEARAKLWKVAFALAAQVTRILAVLDAMTAAIEDHDQRHAAAARVSMARRSARWILALPSRLMLPPNTEKSCENTTTGRPSMRAVPTTTPSAGERVRAGPNAVLLGGDQSADFVRMSPNRRGGRAVSVRSACPALRAVRSPPRETSRPSGCADGLDTLSIRSRSVVSVAMAAGRTPSRRRTSLPITRRFLCATRKVVLKMSRFRPVPP